MCQRQKSSHRLLGVLIFAVMLAGCSDPNGPVTVSGQVTLDGQPIPTGSIRLIPTEGTKGPVNGATIKDGAYEVVARDGVRPGTYRVEIRATRPTGAPKPDHARGLEMFGDPIEQYLPARYNEQSDMTLQVESEMTQDYDLESGA
jgi:hypothetical protein